MGGSLEGGNEQWIETASCYRFICSAGGYTSLYGSRLSLSSCATGLCRPLYNNITSTNGGGGGWKRGKKDVSCPRSGLKHRGLGHKCFIGVVAIV